MNNYYLHHKSSLSNNFVNTNNIIKKWHIIPYNDHKSSYRDKNCENIKNKISEILKSKKSIDDINNIDNPEFKEQINKIVKKYKK